MLLVFANGQHDPVFRMPAPQGLVAIAGMVVAIARSRVSADRSSCSRWSPPSRRALVHASLWQVERAKRGPEAQFASVPLKHPCDALSHRGRLKGKERVCGRRQSSQFGETFWSGSRDAKSTLRANLTRSPKVQPVGRFGCAHQKFSICHIFLSPPTSSSEPRQRKLVLSVDKDLHRLR
jgi:hypothetical protein